VRNAKPEHVEIELRAQIETALDAGIDVTHLDSHMGTVLFPQFVALYAQLGRDYRLPVFAAQPDADSLAKAGLAGYEKILRGAVERMAAQGFPVLDGVELFSLDFAPGGGEAHTRARLDRIGPGIHYLITHPAKDGEELRAIAPDAHARAFEHQFYGSARGREALAREGIRTLGMRALRDLVRS